MVNPLKGLPFCNIAEQLGRAFDPQKVHIRGFWSHSDLRQARLEPSNRLMAFTLNSFKKGIQSSDVRLVSVEPTLAASNSTYLSRTGIFDLHVGPQTQSMIHTACGAVGKE